MPTTSQYIHFLGNHNSGSIRFGNDSMYALVASSSNLSFKIFDSGSTTKEALFITASGDNPRVGVGITNPIKTFDFKGVSDDTRGGELLIRGARPTKGAENNDEVGRIIFSIDSASFGKIDISGSAAEIVALVDNVDETGVTGHLSFRTSNTKTDEPTEILKVSQSTSVLNSPLNLNGSLDMGLYDINASTINRYNNTGTRIELNQNDLEFYGNSYGMKIAGTSVEINPGGIPAVDFIVKSDTDDAAILVDAEYNTITLGSNTNTHITASGNISSSGELIGIINGGVF